jgi:hypothetical protein
LKKANSEWRVANGDVGGRAKPFAIRYSPFAPYLTKKERRVRILITNDDGIHAPGLEVCEQIARTLSDDVWIVAPETDQSGVSHSLSLNDPLRLREVAPKHFAVKGTPTDCVIMGVRHIMKDNPPDLVLSGVNRGQNVAEDVTYSGTIAGAMEGTTLGVPSVRAVAGLWPGDAPEPALGHRAASRAGRDPQGAAGRHSDRRAGQREFSRLRAGCREGHCHHDAGQARPGPAAHRCASRRTRESLLLADVLAQGAAEAGRGD